MFRCLSYAIFKNEDCHREIRRLVLQHMKEIWDEEPQVRLLAAMWYQHITKKQCNVRPSNVTLTAEQYIQEVEMFRNTKWGGSTELEVAANWLKTPIKVFYQGNPRFPPRCWMTYGSMACSANTQTVLLQWTHTMHYDFVTELV